MHLLGNVIVTLRRAFGRPISSVRTSVFAAAMLLAASAAPAMAQDGNLSQNAEAAAKFQAIFQSWKKLDTVNVAATGAISIPSILPIAKATFSSAFGVRSDPFAGSAAMHAGIDLASPSGTPIYATADGIVGRSEWFGGYGNMVQLDHGKGISTRYGHMSKIVARAGARIKRGDLIGYVGSTGRSTGNHLHYEVRIDGRAVNPVPFLQSANYVMAAIQQNADIAQGGPED